MSMFVTLDEDRVRLRRILPTSQLSTEEEFPVFHK